MKDTAQFIKSGGCLPLLTHNFELFLAFLGHVHHQSVGGSELDLTMKMKIKLMNENVFFKKLLGSKFYQIGNGKF